MLGVSDGMMEEIATTAGNPYNTEAALASLDAEFSRLLPAVYVIVLGAMLTGLLGNLLVVVVYVTKFKATTTRSFIVALAVLDLVNCAVGMPLDLLNLSRNFEYPTPPLCKAVASIFSFSYFCSAQVLLLVAADRYWKICRPFASQLTVRLANAAIIASGAVTPIFIWPHVLIWGLRQETIGQLNATFPICDTENRFDNTRYPLIYYYVLLFIFIGGIACLMALYSLIILQIHKGKLSNDSSRPSPPDTVTSPAVSVTNSSTTAPSTTAIQLSPLDQHRTGQSRIPEVIGDFNARGSPLSVVIGGKEDHPGDVSLDPPSRDSDNEQETEITECPSTSFPDSTSDMTGSGTNAAQVSTSDDREPAAENEVVSYTRRNPSRCVYTIKRKRKDKREAIIRRTTFTLLVVTLVYVLSFLPFLVTRMLSAHQVIQIKSWQALVAVEFADRSVFIQSVANPLIYGIRHPEFRDKCKRLFIRRSR